MSSKYVFCGLIGIFILLTIVVDQTEGWQGNFVSYWRYRWSTCTRCICRYWWGCSRYRRYRCTVWTRDWRCKPGWRHNGNRNCNIPICSSGCNDGTCVRPNECVCPSTSTGQSCQQPLCSFQKPCYPGDCYNFDQCNCTAGFVNVPSTSGCLKMGESNKPVIGKSTTIITHLRETDNATLYYFLLDGTDEDPAKSVVWSNQQIFNRLSFEFEMKFDQPEEMPDLPLYVREVGLGIVHADVKLKVTDFRGLTMDRSRYSRNCTGVSSFSPVAEVFNCTIDHLDFKTLVEDADTLTVTFSAYAGGFRRLLNLDDQVLLESQPFESIDATKELEFKFDFRSPAYCSEDNSNITCIQGDTMLEVIKEFTKDPIQLRWSGWADTEHGSGVWYFVIELHTLIVNDERNTLTEMNPIKPAYSGNITADGKREYLFGVTPPVHGMYSVLLEVRDFANNSRLARRFVLYDPDSEITLDASGKGLHVSSAAEETGYLWQSNLAADGSITFHVDWERFFVNKVHEDGKYLNAIQDFPVQFEDVSDGLLNVKKFVDPVLDDNEGDRTKQSIPNLRGIVEFEYAVVLSAEMSEPLLGWQKVQPLDSEVTITKTLSRGQTVQIWVRGYDSVGNKKSAVTNVTIDNTVPEILEDTVKLNMNDNTSGNAFDSTIEMDAFDYNSGVYRIDLDIAILTPGVNTKMKKINVTRPGNFERVIQKVDDQRGCEPSDDEWKCFHRRQKVRMDNCWFMLPNKDHLAVSSATVNVTVYNQAMLSSKTQVSIPKLNKLAGLSIYSGPENVRIENPQHNSFRIAWDLPRQSSCYGQADILLKIQYTVDGKQIERVHRVASDSTFFDVGNVPAETNFIVLFSTALFGGDSTKPELFAAQTGNPPDVSGTSTGAVIGIVLGLLAVFIITLLILVFLAKRGFIKPQEKVQRVRRAATRIYRERVRSAVQPRQNTYFDNRQSELYIYGEMDLEGPQIWHLDRDDVTLESKIKSGHFADIYKATIKNNKTAVAKTLKANYSPEDALLMKAKINFLGTNVGDHPSILKFIGAVVSDDTLGPFIIHEYCENGTLKDYLVAHRSDMSIELQENLFRFGLDIAKGMEFLAGKQIIHRRLAARNILLTFLNEVKITGFGPQPVGEETVGDVEQGKKERIPIKWMAPECMKSTKDANEKSDVWSYAVVLWEIFTLGDTPYSDIRSKELPARVKKGSRLPKPEQSDDTWYGEMTKCWAYSPDKRPTFSELRTELDNMFVQAPGEDYYYYQR